MGRAALLLEGVGQNSKHFRRYRDLYFAYLEQAPGHDQLCRTLASLVVHREQLDAAICKGEKVSSLDLVRTSNAIARLLRELEAHSPKRDEPEDDDPLTYAKRKYQRQEAAA